MQENYYCYHLHFTENEATKRLDDLSEVFTAAKAKIWPGPLGSRVHVLQTQAFCHFAQGKTQKSTI